LSNCTRGCGASPWRTRARLEGFFLSFSIPEVVTGRAASCRLIDLEADPYMGLDSSTFISKDACGKRPLILVRVGPIDLRTVVENSRHLGQCIDSDHFEPFA
jgi:hypothetical protein